jgi:carbamoyl-phosphate synthase large subunit
VSVADRDKSAATAIATQIHDMGFKLLATRGTAKALARMGIPSETINKLSEGSPNVVEAIGRREVDLVINTPFGTGARSDGYEIRAAAVAQRIPCITTMSGGIAAVRAIAAAAHGEPDVVSLQELYAESAPLS